MEDYQSIAAIGIVIITVAIFIYRLCKVSSKNCGGGCSCSVKPKSKNSENTTHE